MTDIVDELAHLARSVAHEVGVEVGRRRHADFAWSTKSSATDIVTEIDEWAERAVVDSITAQRPDDGFLGEEGTSTAGSTGVRWIIDPIDGTTNFVYDLPGFSVSIAAELDGRVVAGAVYDPVRAELFAARIGHGATRNDDAVTTSDKADLATALVETGFSYRPEHRTRQARELVAILPAVRDIRRMGGAALALCSVACGRVDAYYETGLSPWDSAAGGLIAREAGATVVIGDLTVAAAPGIATAFLDLLGVAVPDDAPNRA